MAFLFKVFSGSERLKEKQKSADIVNETFQAELNDVQTKLEVENYELQMLVEMIYDSSYPESQKFLKQPTKDRLYAHKETISSLLFGLAAQGVSVAPSILTHFQKHGCDAIADTLIKLLELVRPLLASKDMPEFTSDDILDAIDIQWHSSVRSSPAFGSLRGSRAPSPLQSPRVSLSNLSPRQSVSSPQSPFSIKRVGSSPGGSSPGQIPPYGLLSPRKTQSFSFSPPSSLPDGTGWEGSSATPPRRSLSSHSPASDVGFSQSYGERLQPLAEHDEESNTGFGKFRKHDDNSAESLPEDEADSCEKLLSYEADEDNGLSRNRPQSSSISEGADGNVYAAEKDIKDFSTAGPSTLAPVLPYSLSSNVNTGEHNKTLSINIPRRSISFEVKELNGGQSAGRTQVAGDHGNRNDDADVKKSNETIVGFLPLGLVRSRSNSFDKSRLVFPHEQSDKSVRDVNAEVPPQGSSVRVGGNKDTAMNILESDVPFRDSFSSSIRERQIPEKDFMAYSSSLSIKRNHVEDSEQRFLEMNGEELSSTDYSLTFKEGVQEDYLHLSEDRVGVVKMIDVPTSQVAKKIQLQTAGDKHDECEEVQEAKDSLAPNSMSHDSSIPTLDQENVVASRDSPHAKEVEDESLDVPELSSLVESSEHDVQREIAPARNSHNKCEIIEASSSSLFQGTNSENTPLLNRASSLHDTQVEKVPQEEPSLSVHRAAVAELGSSSWLEQFTSIQPEGFNEYAGDAEGLADNIENEMKKAEEDTRKFLLGANNEGRDGGVDGVEGDGDKDGNSSSMLSPSSSVEDEKSLASALVEDKEESYSSPVGPSEEYLTEKSGIQAEGEVEAQEQEPPHQRFGVEVGTYILSQSSSSDNYDDDGGDESSSSSSSSSDDGSSSSTSSSSSSDDGSSSSTSSSSSSDDGSSSSTSSSSSSDDGSSSSTSSSSSDKRRSSSSSDDETDDESSLPSVRPKGTEETTPSISVTGLDEDCDFCHVENGGHLFGSDSSGLLSSIDGDENKAHEAEGTGLDEHVNNPELDLEQGAELHSPSYNLVKFDLTKLSTDNNEDISSCFSLQSEDDEVTDVTSEQVVTTNSTSCDGLDMTLVNCSTGNGPTSPSKSAVSPSTVASGASLLSLSPLYEDGLADDITSEVVLSSKIDESQNLCSSVNSDHALDSKVAKRSLAEQREDAERAGVIHSVTPHNKNVNEEGVWKYLSEDETKEHKSLGHSDSDLKVSDGEGETAPPSQNVLEVDLHMKDSEPQFPQQLPIHGDNQQVACVTDSLVSLSSGVVTHASLMGSYVEDGLPSKDLVQNESVMPSHVRDEEANVAELIVGDPSSGGRKESFPNGVPDFQMVHNDSEAFLSSKALSNDFGNSHNMENGSRVSERTEVNTSDDNHSQYAQNEEEQAVTIDSAKPDSEGSKSEDHLLHVEAEKHKVPTFAIPEAKALKLLSVRAEQYEASGSIYQSVERGSGAITKSVNHAVEDPGDFEVSRDIDEEVAASTEQHDKGVFSDQYGINSADSKAEGDKTVATEHVSNQLISTKSEDMLAHRNENDLKEHAIPGTSSPNLSSTVDGEDRNSLIDRVDEAYDTECQKHQSKLADGTTSQFVQFVEKVGVNDYEMGELKHVTEENLLPAQRGEVSVLSVNSAELALFESQSKENSGREDVLQFPEHDHLLLAESKRAGVAGANYMTPSNICNGNMIYPVGHGHNEGKPVKEKDLVVHVDEVSLPSQAEEVEGQDFKQVPDGVNFSNTEGETSRPTEFEDGEETQAASEVLKLSAYGYESSCSRCEHPLEHTHEFFDKSPPAPEHTHPVKGMSEQFLADSALLEKEEELPIKGALLEESRVVLFKNEKVGEAGELIDGIQTAQLSDALTNEEADEGEISNNNEAQQVEKGFDTFLNTAEPAIEGTIEPILHTLERGTEHDEKDNHMGFITGPTTYGVFLHNTKFLDSQGNFVRALTAPVTMARSTEVLQSGPERHSIRDSIICTPASSDRSFRKDQQGKNKNVRQRRYNFLWTLCCSRCSKPSTL